MVLSLFMLKIFAFIGMNITALVVFALFNNLAKKNNKSCKKKIIKRKNRCAIKEVA